jgi:hypothetical protein
MAEEKTPTPTTRVHDFDAEAFCLEGRFHRPVRHEVRPRASARLPREGGYFHERAEPYRFHGLLSHAGSYVHVAGNRSLKPGYGWVTLATSVIEGLNIMDVVTADRIVAQISTEYPLEGYVPTVTFLGTRFENLQIAGHPVQVEMDGEFFGDKPANDLTYHSEKGFRERVAAQRERILKGPNLPDEIAGRYNRLPQSPTPEETIECSLVQRVEGSYPGRSYGHAIDVPHFGKLYLGVVRLEQSVYRTETGEHPKTTIGLTMIEAKMGCIGDGQLGAGNGKTNGNTKP